MRCAGCDLDARLNGEYCSTSCYKKHYELLNIDKIKANKVKHYQNNKEKIISNVNKWRGLNKEKVGVTTAKSKKKNRKPLTYSQKIKHAIRTRMNGALKGRVKPDSVTKNLGCSWDEFEKHMENQFYPHPVSGALMTWKNMGKYFHGANAWNIDHKQALYSFDLCDPKQFKNACHYANLQPLWHEDHIKKTKEDIQKVKQCRTF